MSVEKVVGRLMYYKTDNILYLFLENLGTKKIMQKIRLHNCN